MSTQQTANQKESKPKKKSAPSKENFFQAIFNSHQAIMLLIDPVNGRIIDANNAAVKFYKYSKEKLTGLSIQDINQLDPVQVKEEWMKALRDERNYFVFPHKLADGQIRYVEVHSSSFYYGEKHLLCSIIHDITEKRKAEEALQKSEEKFEVAFKSNPNAIILSALKTGVTYEVNDTFCTLLGFNKEEVIGKTSLDLDVYLSPEDRKRIMDVVQQKGSISNYEIQLKHKTGKPVWVLFSSEYLKTTMEEIILTTLQDITERKKMEEQRKKEHNLLQVIFDTVPAMIWVYDPNINNLNINREFERVTGWTKEDVLKTNILELAYPDEQYRKEVEDYIQSFKPGFKDIKMTCKDGTVKDTLWSNVSAGNNLSIGIGIDISNRIMEQQELLRSKNIISAALASTTDAIYITNEKGIVVEYNESFLSFYRIRQTLPFSSPFKPDYTLYEFFNQDGKRAQIDELPIARALRGEKVKKTELLILKKDTGEKWCGSFSFAPIRNKEGVITGSIGVARDVTESKEAEKEREFLIKQLAADKEALAESEQKYRTMGEAIDYGVWAADAKGMITYLSESFCKLAGMSFEELRLNGFREFLGKERFQEVKDIWFQSVETGTPYEQEYEFNLKDGNKKYLLARAHPVRNREGEIVSWAGIHLDITERKKANEQLAEKNKYLTWINEVLEDFVHIAAHDLRSPIGNLLTINQMIVEETDPERKATLFRMINPVTKRLQLTVDGLLEMVSLQIEEQVYAEKININEVWKELNEILDSEIRAFNGNISYDFSATPEICYARAYLVSILKNLVTNAIKYSKKDGNSFVKISSGKMGEYFRIEIRDNGIGIDLEKAGKNLFKPFRRFTNTAEGTGLGLYVIKSIIEKNGGYIQVESQPGIGTTFNCYLKEFPL